LQAPAGKKYSPLLSTFRSTIQMSGQGSVATPSSAGFLMWRATNAWQRAQRAALEAFGLTHVQYALLATLAADDARKGLSQAEVSGRSGVDPMTTSQVIRNLEARELVARAASAEDKRAQRVTLTTAGRALVRKALPKVEKADADFFAVAGKNQGAITSALASLAGVEA
jgi:MarR family transcriptional regulator, organic hydroperoxide resistance regulator